MNIQQMRYVLAVADNGSFHSAAKALFISQPTLSNSIQKLETELHVQLFKRTRQGTFLTTSGAAFVNQARKIVTDTENLQHSFTNKPVATRYFSVSARHYDGIGTAMCRVMERYPNYQYLRAYESTIAKIIQDTAQGKSEIGVVFLNDVNQAHIINALGQNNLVYDTLGNFQSQILIRQEHPLSRKPVIEKRDLSQYPQIRFTQDATYSEFTDDPFVLPGSGPIIAINDRVTMTNIINQTDAYTVGSAILETPQKSGLIARALHDVPKNQIVVLRQATHELSEVAQYFISELKVCLADNLVELN